MLVSIDLPIPADAQLLTWQKIKHKGVDWWRPTLKSDGRLNNGTCTLGAVPTTGAGVPPGGIAKIGVSIACEIVENPTLPPGALPQRTPKRRTQLRFVLTIAATAPGSADACPRTGLHSP